MRDEGRFINVIAEIWFSSAAKDVEAICEDFRIPRDKHSTGRVQGKEKRKGMSRSRRSIDL